VASAIRLGWSVRRKSKYYSNRLAVLTAAPRGGWSCGFFQDWSPPGPLCCPRSLSVEPINHPPRFYGSPHANAVSGVTH
jgi:hypothetical protein